MTNCEKFGYLSYVCCEGEPEVCLEEGGHHHGREEAAGPRPDDDKENLQTGLGLLGQPQQMPGDNTPAAFYGARGDGFDNMEEEGDEDEEEEDMDEKDDGSYSATFVSYCNTT